MADPQSPEHDQRIDYVEFAAADVAAAKRFYAGAFGWRFEDYGPDYAAFHDGRLAGGFTTDPATATRAPLVVLYAVDLEATLARVEAAGGRITRPIFAFPGGRRFQFTDPEGNELAVWSE